MKPNIILLGVHHSGTTPITAMIHKLGWKYTETDPDYIKRQSYKAIVNANRHLIDCLRGELVPIDDLMVKSLLSIAKDIPSPWVLKDPRFSLTLEYWPFEKIDNTILFYITRTTERLKKSFKKRHQMTGGVPGESGHSVDAWVKHANRQYELWEGPKFKLAYDDIHSAFKVWDPSRKSHKNKKFGRIGY